jgi:hypothetical protein
MEKLPESIDGLPDLCGSEPRIRETVLRERDRRVFPAGNGFDFGRVRSAAAIALHMHQPLVPAGGDDLGSAAIISNLKLMMDNPHVGDNHNAPVFRWCYRRMLDYSGTLLHGLWAMGLHDVLDSLRNVTCDPEYRNAVEWLGSAWGHPVAPSTPVQDFRLHVQAWQHHFAAIFGFEALGRVRGFSPAEMALPNHPDVAYEFVRTLRDCGYRWVLVQEHSVEQPDGRAPDRKHLPHRLLCTSSGGETASILAVVKTQGSDTKLVGQMQPYYEAKGLARFDVAGAMVPPLVTQIADGENGGVMMNEFPPKYLDVVRESSGSDTVLMNVTEYLENLFASGVKEEDLPVLQPILQKRIRDRFEPGQGPDRLARVIDELRKEDSRFHVEGGSWTNNISWVHGYDALLGPMERVSSLFHEKVLKPGLPAHEPRYRNALFHLLTSQTSCYRYWGQGVWVDYGREICRRATEILTRDY